MPVNVGLDLSDEYINAYSLENTRSLSFPTVVCRERREDKWYIGEEAYRVALSGRGVLTDKLLSLLLKDGSSTIGQKAYSAKELISKLVETVLMRLLDSSALDELGRLVIALKSVNREELDEVVGAIQDAGISRDKISVISHEEAFIHYMLSQDRKLTFNLVGLFDLSEEGLSFYRMRLLRGAARFSAVADSSDLKEAFRIGITKNESGSLIGDRLLTGAAKKCMGSDIYSSVLLTGKGFENTAWAKNFIDFVCKKRRVMYEAGLFAIGAALYADSLSRDEEDEYLIYCDTRTRQSVSLGVSLGERQAKLILSPSGSPWYEVNAYAEVLPKGQNFIDIDIEPVERSKPKRTVRLELSNFPSRPDRCTRVAVEIRYPDVSTLDIEVEDMGFGEIYPSSGKSIKKTLKL